MPRPRLPSTYRRTIRQCSCITATSIFWPDQAEDYYAALVEAGVDAELYLHRWRGHATMFLFGGDAETRAIDFLDRVNESAAVAANSSTTD